ncbi:MAG: hypothetical protein Kow0090_19870 [Myxococcota bacterium]
MNTEDKKRAIGELERLVNKIGEKDFEAIRDKMPGKLERLKKGGVGAGIMKKLLRRARLFYGLIFDKEFKTDWKVYAATGAALLYFINPLDIIPDVILGLGWLDDFYVLGWVLRIYDDEIRRYIEFRGLNQEDYY